MHDSYFFMLINYVIYLAIVMIIGLDVWNPRISELVKRSKVVHLQWKDAGRPSNICPIATERKDIRDNFVLKSKDQLEP